MLSITARLNAERDPFSMRAIDLMNWFPIERTTCGSEDLLNVDAV